MWPRYFAFSKKLHKILMWLVIILGSVMMISGYLMNRELANEVKMPIEKSLQIRRIHVTFSMWFLWALLLQIITGLSIWFVPKIIRTQAQ